MLSTHTTTLLPPVTRMHQPTGARRQVPRREAQDPCPGRRPLCRRRQGEEDGYVRVGVSWMLSSSWIDTRPPPTDGRPAGKKAKAGNGGKGKGKEEEEGVFRFFARVDGWMDACVCASLSPLLLEP